MTVDPDRNVILRGERELAERAGHLFLRAEREFVCAAGDLKTWSMPGMRARISGAGPRTAPAPTVRKLFNPQVLDDEESERHLVEVAAHGVHVRICATALPHETIIIDDRIAILAGPSVRGTRTYTVVRSPDVVRSVSSLFRATWETAVGLAEFRRARPPVLDQESRRILTVLGAGYKDETAARELGLSLRTYRRRVAELMKALDAGSRFEAGLRAHELGLTG
ncbi:DNA-binding response regulator [Streptosporangium sp. NPDC051022]|uniref:DNA-binding response regulator n=1 Tax=Streptosporangium sp. NPDC051022 TaxID=3155752 RepID=UPI00343EBCF9